MIEPDIAFHRRLQRPDVQAELRNSGKQPLEDLDKELAQDMKSVQDHLNAGFALNAGRVWADGQHPIVYCDFIKPSEQRKELIGAYAFSDSEHYFIGLTTPLVIRLSECSGYLAESPYVRNLFRVPFGDDVIKDQVRATILYRLFFGHQLNFVVCHELGHHFFGHTMSEENGFCKEFALDSQRQSSAALTSHAYEIQADDYASEFMLTALFETDVRENSLKLLGRLSSDLQGRELLIGIYLIAVCGVLFALGNPLFNEERLAKNHPLKAARLSNMVSNIDLYLSRAAPDLIGWLTNVKFQAFLEAVKYSIPPRPTSWDDETSYLLSEDGAKYYKI